ncbi:hypothetical protein [Adhaeribacter aquaticus]|uniref:hypothetical protein n=1 Tax=Adhaeribacter aquaticus TaxID=299567 RepID=UPI0003FD094B|nr:hypothetical protein [Adhaeribacter aquaticus]
MPLQSAIENRLAKKYASSSRLDDVYNGKDLTYITNQNGDPVTLFIGKRNPDGSIAGERYVRRIQYAPDGLTIVKSHWDFKGKVYRS